jgi:hypothetical protein
LVEPVDALDPSNPPTYAELLEFLTRDFVQNGWSLKHLHRTIVTSAAYQTVGNVRGPIPEGAGELVYRLRPLSHVQLVRSLESVARSAHRERDQASSSYLFIGLPVDQIDSGVARAIELFEGQRSSGFGREMALYLLHDAGLLTRLGSPEGWLATEVGTGAGVTHICEQLYLQLYSRRPERNEVEVVRAYLSDQPRSMQRWVDVAWSMVNSPEFYLNH